MEIGQLKDIENGDINRHEELEQPFIRRKRVVAHEDSDSWNNIKNGSIGMVLLSTGVAVCGSFQFGICVSNLSISINIVFLTFCNSQVIFKIGCLSFLSAPLKFLA